MADIAKWFVDNGVKVPDGGESSGVDNNNANDSGLNDTVAVVDENLRRANVMLHGMLDDNDYVSVNTLSN